MHNFSDFKITTETKGFTGEKIKIKKVLNKRITVLDSKIEQSKFEGKGDCLHLQIEVDGIKHVVFTGSVKLLEQIRKVPQHGYPFNTTIVENSERYEFT